jgi:hypothetical protein
VYVLRPTCCYDDFIDCFEQAFAEGKGAVAAAQQRQRLPYLVTVARQSPLGFSRPATDSGRWMSQQGTSSSLERTGGSAGPLAEEVGWHLLHELPWTAYVIFELGP